MSAVLAFFLGPVGRWVAILAAFLAWTVYQREQAATAAREECQAAQLQKTLTEVLRQRDAAQAALEEAARQAAQTAREMSALDEERNAALQQLAERGVDSCDIPDDVLDRLRNIR